MTNAGWIISLVLTFSMMQIPQPFLQLNTLIQLFWGVSFLLLVILPVLAPKQTARRFRSIEHILRAAAARRSSAP